MDLLSHGQESIKAVERHEESPSFGDPDYCRSRDRSFPAETPFMVFMVTAHVKKWEVEAKGKQNWSLRQRDRNFLFCLVVPKRH